MLIGILKILPLIPCTFYECTTSETYNPVKEENSQVQSLEEQAEYFLQQGLNYEIGEGVNIDYIAAKELYEKAASLGSIQALHNLGSLYNWGMGVDQDRATALSLWEEAAFAGNMYSSFNMANAFLTGNGRNESEDQALDYYLASYEQGYEPAICHYGNIMSKRKPENVIRIVELMEGAALSGEVLCTQAISWLLYEGYEQHNDPDKLLYWSEFGVETENAEATFVQALIYDFGEKGIEADAEKAKQVYLKAAALGRENAFANLGFMYEVGKFGNKDPITAKYYYEKAIEADEVWGYNNLATFYREGIGKEVDYHKALELYWQAADKGNSYAYRNLALMYHLGSGVEADAYEAETLFKKSISLGYDQSKLDLAKLYLDRNLPLYNRSLALDYLYESVKDGINFALETLAEQFKEEERKWFVASKGSAQLAFEFAEVYSEADNVVEACNWYLVAFERRHEESYLNLLDCVRDNNLLNSPFKTNLEVAENWAEYQGWNADSLIGELYYYGISVAKDKLIAASFFERAHQSSNDSIAQFKLGMMYINGDGVAQDEGLGRQYFELSSKQGVSAAFRELANVYRKGKGVSIDLSTAFQYAKKAAEFVDDAGSAYLYAEMLLNGEGVERDISLAVDWFDRAIQLGHYKAQCKLGSVLDNFHQNQNDKVRAAQLLEHC
ncbi:sel1 repeat family protein [Alteromonas sp. ALT199]|uniref:tetratricopeptide repeat protein n=1 Tax=unclassified Alteromonas TaxID=2614992 RepID=UPI001BE68F95|nr:tetratricopeptide repeat protein [Alteromonas sp. ALT199]MBT3136892.1 sel1 repeat family protein [Alteromonas sp. ALT199]